MKICIYFSIAIALHERRHHAVNARDGQKLVEHVTDELDKGYKSVYDTIGNIPLTKDTKQTFNEFVAKRRLTPDYKTALQDEVDGTFDVETTNGVE